VTEQYYVQRSIAVATNVAAGNKTESKQIACPIVGCDAPACTCTTELRVVKEVRRRNANPTRVAGARLLRIAASQTARAPALVR